MSASLTDLINQQRTSRGLGPLTASASLITAATKYAGVLWAYDPYSLNHNLDGDAMTRANREGYYGWIGEVLVTGNPSAQELVNLWMSSPPHAQILLGDFAEIGVGCQEGPYTSNGATFQLATCSGMVGKRA